MDWVRLDPENQENLIFKPKLGVEFSVRVKNDPKKESCFICQSVGNDGTDKKIVIPSEKEIKDPNFIFKFSNSYGSVNEKYGRFSLICLHQQDLISIKKILSVLNNIPS